MPPAAMAGLVDRRGRARRALPLASSASSDFDGIELALPTRTFDGELELEVGGRAVELIEVGPAHTRGDVLAHLPDARRSSPATSSSSAAPRSCGPGRCPTGSRPATGSSPSTSSRWSPATARDGQGRRGRGAGLPHLHRPGGDGPLRGRRGRLGGGPGHRPRDRRRCLRRPGGAGPRQRQRRDRLPDARPQPPAPNVVDLFRHMAALDGR